MSNLDKIDAINERHADFEKALDGDSARSCSKPMTNSNRKRARPLIAGAFGDFRAQQEVRRNARST